MTTLIYSTRMHSRQNILTYTAESVDYAVNTFIDKLFNQANVKKASLRLDIRNGRYFYTPSDEYNSIPAKFIRYKNYKR